MGEERRRFGTIRKRESGRYQVRYRGLDGLMRSAPETFARKSEAERYLTLIESQMIRGEWIDPDRAKISVTDYAERWIVQRPKLRPRTVALYEWTLRKHITPYIGGIELGRLDTPIVRQWRSDLLADGVSISGAAKAYRLLRAVLMTAVNEDELIRRNPCRIPGADQEKAAERPVLNLAQVFALADAVPARYRALILVTTFGCLRWGEAAALQRQDLDLEVGSVSVRRQLTEVRGAGLAFGPPKSRAGRRRVSLPKSVVSAVRAHLAEFVDDDDEALVFTGDTGKPMWRGNFNNLVSWRDTVAAIGVPGLHFHDLRHTGNTIAAQTGPSTRDLMARMGHDSPQAAMIYQHATAEADRAIADAVQKAIKAEQKKAKKEAERGIVKPAKKGKRKRDETGDPEAA